MAKRLFGLWILIVALAGGEVTRAQPGQAGATLAAASAGKGAVRLIWPPPYGEGPWKPEGYLLERLEGAGSAVVLARGLLPGQDPSAMARIPPAQAAAIRQLVTQGGEAASGRDVEGFQGLLTILTLVSLTDYDVARAMGLAFEDRPLGGGPFTYRLTDAHGALLAASPPVDPRTATPLSGPPGDLKAEATPLGVHLSWTRPSPHDVPPTFSFRVLRDDGSGFKALQDAPILYRHEGKEGREAQGRFSDAKPPLERSVRYTVVEVDLFGRETSQAEPISLFVPDFDAAVPPEDFRAEVQGAAVALSWKPKANPRTTGYLLEKSPFEAGPFTSLSEKPLSRSTAAFTDTGTFPGQRLYYRIASLDPRGQAGPPCPPVGVVCRAAAPPTPPQNLTATLGMGVVTLRWQPVEAPLLGYQVQKALSDSEKWSPASSRITPEPRFDDRIEPGQWGTARYRVVAVGSDNQASAPSEVLTVPLPDNNPPPRPRITAYDGAGGSVTLSFVPGVPEEETSGFLVLRGSPGRPQMGVLTERPLPPSARTFEDDHVVPNLEYTYEVVAVDEAQNRSLPSGRVTVTVGEPSLPAPPVPKAAFEAKPFPRVRITWAPPKFFVNVVLERRLDGERLWGRVAGPLPPETSEAVDVHPPGSGRVSYRTYYQTPAGSPGPPSEPVTLSVGR